MTRETFPRAGRLAEDAYRIVHGELSSEAPAGANLGSFVHPRMDAWAEQLILETIGKNLVCSGEYQASVAIHDRLVATLSELFHAPGASGSGTATAGSSEAIQLGLLALKFAWRERRRSAGLSCDRPNLVFFADSHVCWDKFCRFFDVEPRKVPIERRGAGYGHSVDALIERVDEHTIAVGAVAGTTYTGDLHPIAAIGERLDALEEARGWDVGIHVDAAIGGFLCPFLEEDGLIEAWDFRVPRVRSINVSGHKFGLVYPGLGWLLFRDESCVSPDLVFDAPYLGNALETFTLNFSRSAAPVVSQYFALLHHGREGYRQIARRALGLARELAVRIAGHCEIVSSGALPVVCFRPAARIDAFELSRRLRSCGFVVPAYEMPEGGAGDGVLRVVVHERFDATLVARLAEAIDAMCSELSANAA